jgi:hypothetical protein
MRASGDVTLFAARQHHRWIRHGAEKYAKFAYSTRFGFSLPGGRARWSGGRSWRVRCCVWSGADGFEH